MGYCNGIENYSRHLTGRAAGRAAADACSTTSPKDSCCVIDESHQTVPQIGAMYRGDRSRKETLVELRLPPALRARQPAAEVRRVRGAGAHGRLRLAPRRPSTSSRSAKGVVVEQIIRPTGLVDPAGRGAPARDPGRRPARGDPPAVSRRSERVLVTTLTKRMAEDLTEYYAEVGVHVRYLHSDIDTLERIEIIRELRLGDFDVLVGINLLREGLDIPEVVAGGASSTPTRRASCARSARSSRPSAAPRATSNGRVILYADDDDRLDAARHRRDRPPPRQAARLQRGARHHPARPSRRPSARSACRTADRRTPTVLCADGEDRLERRREISADSASPSCAKDMLRGRRGARVRARRGDAAIEIKARSRHGARPSARGLTSTQVQRMQPTIDAKLEQPAHRARRLPDEGPPRRGDLRRQGQEPAQPRAQLLHRHRTRAPSSRCSSDLLGDLEMVVTAQREGGAAPRERAHQAAPAALQRQAPRRQGLPLPAARPDADLAAPRGGATLRARRGALLRPVLTRPAPSARRCASSTATSSCAPAPTTCSPAASGPACSTRSSAARRPASTTSPTARTPRTSRTSSAFLRRGTTSW